MAIEAASGPCSRRLDGQLPFLVHFECLLSQDTGLQCLFLQYLQATQVADLVFAGAFTEIIAGCSELEV